VARAPHLSSGGDSAHQGDGLTLNPKPETQKPKTETWNPKPENRNPKTETRNLKPENRNPTPAR